MPDSRNEKAASPAEPPQTVVLPDDRVEMERLIIGWLFDHGYEFEISGHSTSCTRLTIYHRRRQETPRRDTPTQLEAGL